MALTSAAVASTHENQKWIGGCVFYGRNSLTARGFGANGLSSGYSSSTT
jgi:hypothetical protein